MTCPHCNRWGEECKPAQCEGCGTWQCFSNGSRNGRCKVCLYGHLSGWSKGCGYTGCGYKGCDREAVFFGVPRVKRCCAECAPRVKIAIFTPIPGMMRSARASEPLDAYVRRMVQENARRYRRA